VLGSASYIIYKLLDYECMILSKLVYIIT